MMRVYAYVVAVGIPALCVLYLIGSGVVALVKRAVWRPDE